MVLAGLALVVAAGMVALCRSSSRITQENFERIAPGMSLSEVTDILGAPGDYTTGPTRRSRKSMYSNELIWDDFNNFRVWSSDTALVIVKIDAKKTVENADFTPMQRLPQGPLDGLLWRAKRLWWRLFP
jgi:hypothetical protein